MNQRNVSGVELKTLNVAARSVLLDALIALEQHQEALVLVGAQAVYLRTENVPLSVAAYTSDGDLSINPDLVTDEPLIEKAMEQAGFRLAKSIKGAQCPGLWLRTNGFSTNHNV